MPVFHTRTFRVRHHECDRYGRVHPANYLRYMQETAFDAAEAVGFGMRYFESNPYVWLVRETEVEYLRRLGYGASLAVKTWVEDLRRTRSRRAYEMADAETGALVARAATDWVYVHTASGRPASVPAEMIAAFGLSHQAEAGPRPKFPSPPSPPPGLFTTRRQVQWHALDSMGHMNNAAYLEYVDDCGRQALAAHGWPPGRIRECGFDILVRRHQIEYKQPALPDDVLEVSTWISGMQGTSATRHYTIRRVADRALLARVHASCVWVDLAAGSLIPVPAGFAAALEPNTVDGRRA
jgi:acyl-CoA thioester hydrolase